MQKMLSISPETLAKGEWTDTNIFFFTIYTEAWCEQSKTCTREKFQARKTIFKTYTTKFWARAPAVLHAVQTLLQSITLNRKVSPRHLPRSFRQKFRKTGKRAATYIPIRTYNVRVENYVMISLHGQRYFARGANEIRDLHVSAR